MDDGDKVMIILLWIIIIIGAVIYKGCNMIIYRELTATVKTVNYVLEKEGEERYITLEIEWPNKKKENLILKGAKELTTFRPNEVYRIKYVREDKTIKERELIEIRK
jgi:hypothetical protein